MATAGRRPSQGGEAGGRRPPETRVAIRGGRLDWLGEIGDHRPTESNSEVAAAGRLPDMDQADLELRSKQNIQKLFL